MFTGDKEEIPEFPVVSIPRTKSIPQEKLNPPSAPARSNEVQHAVQDKLARGNSTMVAGHCSKAASTNNPSRSSNTRKSLSDHLKRKSNNVVRPTIGGISSYAHLVEMEINKMKIECHKRELEISTLEHTQKMRAEQERKKC